MAPQFAFSYDDLISLVEEHKFDLSFFFAHIFAHLEFCSTEVAAAAAAATAATGAAASVTELNQPQRGSLSDELRGEPSLKRGSGTSNSFETRPERGSHRARKAPDHFDPGAFL